MKIKQIESILKCTKYITLYDAGKFQWVSDGVASYPLYNMPWLDEESLFTMLDVPKDSRNKYIFRHFDLENVPLNFVDIVSDEKVLERNMMTLNITGRTIEPLKTSKGIVFLDVKYLKPFADEQSVELGIIMPFDPLNDTFVELLTELTNLSVCKWELKKRVMETQTLQETIEWDEIDNGKEDGNE